MQSRLSRRFGSVENLESRFLLVAATVLAADINQLPIGSYPDNLTKVDETLFFSTDDGAIWKSDGTESGTIRVADVPPRLHPHSVGQFVSFQHRLFFVSDDYELWQTDGTPEGTSLVAEFSESTETARIQTIVAAGDHLIVSVKHFGNPGRSSLWSVDVTTAQTIKTKLFAQDRQVASDILLTSTVNGAAFFLLAEAANASRTLWSTDGTLEGTKRVASAATFGDSATLKSIHPLNQGIAISVDGGGFDDWSLWYYEHATGTLAKLNSGASVFNEVEWVDAISDGTIYFVTSRLQRFELWRSQGQSGDAVQIAQLGNDFQLSSRSHVMAQNRVFFNSRIGDTEGVVVSDGTEAGTQMVLPANNVRRLYLAGDRVFALANGELFSIGVNDLSLRQEGQVFANSLADPPGYEFNAISFGSELLFAPSGVAMDAELWGLNVATGDKRMIANADRRTESSTPTNLRAIGSSLFFVADSGASGREAHVLKSDGTVKQISNADFHDLFAPGAPVYFERIGEQIVYSGFGPTDQTGLQYGLWAIDSQSQVVTLLREFSYSNEGEIREFTVDGNVAYFIAGTPETGVEVWGTDGSIKGTKLIADVVPGPGSSFPRGLQAKSGTLYFEALDAEEKMKHWTSDGTSANTHMIQGLSVSTSFTSVTNNRTIVDGELFVVTLAPLGQQPILGVWRSDGTPSGTMLVRDLGSASATRRIEAVVENVVYFVINQGDGRGLQLWRTDGTFDGTQLLLTGVDSEPVTRIEYAGQSANGLVFLLRNNGSRSEVWRTRGTSMTTERISILPDGEVAFLHDAPLFAATGNVFFTAEAAGGNEVVWATNGTTHGTRIMPWPTDSFTHLINGSDWARIDDKLMFAAVHPVQGDELFSFLLDGDTNLDGRTDLTDLNNVRNNFAMAGNPIGDLNGDGVVDLEDLNQVRNFFGDAQQFVNPRAQFLPSRQLRSTDAAVYRAVDDVHESDALFSVAFSAVERVPKRLARNRSLKR